MQTRKKRGWGKKSQIWNQDSKWTWNYYPRLPRSLLWWPGFGSMSPSFRVWGWKSFSFLIHVPAKGEKGQLHICKVNPLQGRQQNQAPRPVSQRGGRLLTGPLVFCSPDSPPHLPSHIFMPSTTCSKISVELNLWIIISVWFPSVIRQGDKVLISASDEIWQGIPVFM